MQALGSLDAAPKRIFHNKVRTGCTTCKQRRVKCDEAKPTCLRCRASGKQCLGYPTLPAPKIFEPSSEAVKSTTSEAPPGQVEDDGDRRPSDGGSLISNQSSLLLPALTRRDSSRSNPESDFSFNDFSTTPLSILESISPGFSSASEKYSHDFFRHWLSAYTAPRAATVPDLWTVHYPQVGSAVPAIQSVMLANGTIGMSLLRKDTPSEYEQARLAALEHVNSAITYLRTHPQPPHIITMIAWLFWLLDMAQGLFQSSTMHIESALKVGTTNLTHPSTPEESAIVQLLHDVTDSRAFTQSLERAYPYTLSRTTPPRQRMAACVPLFRQTISRVLLAQLKLAFDDPPSSSSSSSPPSLLTPSDKAALLTSLRRLRRELEWLVTRWSSRICSTTNPFLPSSTSSSSEEGKKSTSVAPEAEANKTDLLSPYLEEIATGEHSVETLQVALARAVPVFVSRASHDDIEMRQDLVELLQLVSGGWEEG
jgi:hypothetical protein